MPSAVLFQSLYLDASTNISKSQSISWYSYALASSLMPYWHQWNLIGRCIILLNLSFRAFRLRRQAKFATAHQAQGLAPVGRISLTHIDLQLLGTIRIRGVVASWQSPLFRAWRLWCQVQLAYCCCRCGIAHGYCVDGFILLQWLLPYVEAVKAICAYRLPCQLSLPDCRSHSVFGSCKDYIAFTPQSYYRITEQQGQVCAPRSPAFRYPAKP